MTNSPADVLAAVAEQVRTLASAPAAWALSIENDVEVERASAPAGASSALPETASLLRAARAALAARGTTPAREGAFVVSALPDASGEEVVGLVVVAATEAASSAPGFDTALRELATLAGLRLENARLRASAAVTTKAREVLLASVSHDLRNPLNTFAMSTGLLRDDLERKDIDPTRGLTLVTRMERATSRMQSMIEDLVEASRVDAGLVDYQAKREVVATLVRDAAKAAEPKGKEKAPAVVPEDLDESLAVQADRTRTLQLFAKLVQFFAKGTGESGTIHVRAAREGDVVRFTITGYGPGKMNLARADEGRAGLSLLLARGLATGQKGALRLEDGEGMVVSFTLPSAPG